MRRQLYEADHELFRDLVRDFVANEVAPNIAAWDEGRMIDRALWSTAGELGILGLNGPERFGGGGQLRDYRYRNIVNEELARAAAGSVSVSFALQDDLVLPYFVELATEDQQHR